MLPLVVVAPRFFFPRGESRPFPPALHCLFACLLLFRFFLSLSSFCLLSCTCACACLCCHFANVGGRESLFSSLLKCKAAKEKCNRNLSVRFTKRNTTQHDTIDRPSPENPRARCSWLRQQRPKSPSKIKIKQNEKKTQAK